MFDTIAAHQLEDTTTFAVCLPDGSPATVHAPGVDAEGEPNTRPITMTVRRLSSSLMQKFINARKNAQIMGLKKQQRANKPMAVTAESIRDNAAETLIFAVVAWDGFTADGTPVPCTPDNVRSLVTDDAYVWIREQIDNTVGDDTLYDLGNS
jgi:hypothetical protein